MQPEAELNKDVSAEPEPVPAGIFWPTRQRLAGAEKHATERGFAGVLANEAEMTAPCGVVGVCCDMTK